MQRTHKMRTYPQRPRQALPQHSTFKGSVIHLIPTIRDNVINMCQIRKQRIHTTQHHRHLLVFKTHQCRFFYRLTHPLHTRQVAQRLKPITTIHKRLTRHRCDTQIRVELREQTLHHHSKTVHHTQHAHHRSSHHTHCRSTDTGNDIDGVMTLFGKQITPSDNMFYPTQLPQIIGATTGLCAPFYLSFRPNGNAIPG